MKNRKPEDENTRPKTVVIYCQAATKEFAACRKKELKYNAKYLGAAIEAVLVDIIPARTEWEKARTYCRADIVGAKERAGAEAALLS